MKARQQDGRRAAYIAGFDAMGLGRGQVNLDFQSRLINGEIHLRIGDTVNLRQSLPHLLRLTAQDIQVFAKDAHSEAVAGARRWRAERLLQIGPHLAIQPGVTVNRLLNGGHCRIMVGLGIHLDPQPGGIDADHLVPKHRPPYVGTDVLNAWSRAQLATGPSHDPVHSCIGRAGRAIQLDQDVWFFE